MAVDVVPADPDAVARIKALLEGEGLPTTGLFDPPTTMLAARSGGDVVGGGALEEHGDYGLVRSLVVAADARGRGVGSALIAGLEGVARARRLAGVYLLTETAEGFFASRGWVRTGRQGAPEPVKASVEWSVLCGDSAVAMTLGP